MRENFYEKNTANFPRIATDVFFADYENKYSYDNFIDDTFKFIEEFQLLNSELWHRFVQQFREDDADFDAGWRCEYWGKMMRGACFVYSYTKNKELYEILSRTIEEMINSADESGRISTYATNHEFDGWDVWGRKYVLLGMQYFLEICDDDELYNKIVNSMCKQVDYIIGKIGSEEGKMPITSATRHWRGVNSSSILEPVVRLYSITAKKKYFDFAKYIVDCGGADVVNIFDLAYENDFYPYQYPVTKAYEVTSCFEGLLEFYRITGNEKYKTAIINFADKILESDFTVIGCSGCTHELFDHSTVRQANTTNGEIQQETCVTVTLMKFFYQLTLLTGNPKYVDAFEISLYNAYLGAVNTEKVIEPNIKAEHPDWCLEALPFDSYSPLTAGTRGNGIGGIRLMSDNHYYGCCACIGSAGIGLVPKMQLLTTQNGFALNLFVNGKVTSKTPKNNEIKFITETNYPKDGEINIKIDTNVPEQFEILIRNPKWSKNTAISVNGTEIESANGYISIEREWQNGDIITISLDMRTEMMHPISYGTDILMNKVIWGANYMVSTFDREDPEAKNHIALRRGPIMLAQDSRLGYDLETPISVMKNENGYVETCVTITDKYPNIIAVDIPLSNGKSITVTDYASAGKLWNEKIKIAVWMKSCEQ